MLPVVALILPDRLTFEAVIFPLSKWKLEPLISTVLPFAVKVVTSIAKLEPDIFPPVNNTLEPVI